MNYLGDFTEDATVYIPFNTFSSDDPSASVTITNLADADVMVHKDGGLTQIATDGATVVIDFDSITGNHLITIDTSVHADYSTGSDYLVRIEGTTVDGATINAWVGSFSIQNRYMRGTESAYTGTPPTAAAIVDEWETQSQADPTGFHVNFKELDGEAVLYYDDGVNAHYLKTAPKYNDSGVLLALAAISEARLAELDAANLPTDVAAIPAAILATALADVYAAHGVAPTLQQAIMWIHQSLDDFAISSTTRTVRKLDDTAAGTGTLDDATNPTSLTRAT